MSVTQPRQQRFWWPGELGLATVVAFWHLSRALQNHCDAATPLRRVGRMVNDSADGNNLQLVASS